MDSGRRADEGEIHFALVPRLLTFLAYVLVGVGGGQIAGWLVGIVLAFANVTNIVGSIFGEDVAFGALFLTQSMVYAGFVAIATAAGLGALSARDDIDGTELAVGVAAAVWAFALVTFWAEPYAQLIADTLPRAFATWLLEQTGILEFVFAVAFQAVPVALFALVTYGAIIAWGRTVAASRDG